MHLTVLFVCHNIPDCVVNRTWMTGEACITCMHQTLFTKFYGAHLSDDFLKFLRNTDCLMKIYLYANVT